MKLKILGSGSSGNCYLLESEAECLVIEAGISLKEVKKAIDFNIRKIVGVLITHCHGDHSKFYGDYTKTGIPVFAPYLENFENSIQFGNFKIKAFSLVHDVPCFGFHIQHKDIGSMVYASDTEYIKYKFKDINHFLVEANYDMQFVNKENPNYAHVLQGHMSIDTTCEFLKVNNNQNLKNVILCHLSPSNSDGIHFIKKVKQVVDCPIYVACSGMEIDLDDTPEWMR